MKTKPTKNNKQLVHKKTTTSYISLPQSLSEAIQSLNLSKTDKSHCYKFVGILLRDSLDEHGDLVSFTPKPQKYIIKSFDNSYHLWLYELLNNHIVIRSDYYSHEEGICYDYKVSPSFFLEEGLSSTLCIYKSCKPLISLGYKDIIKGINHETNTLYNWFADDMDSLVIDYNKLESILKDKLDNLSIDQFEVDYQIQAKSVQLTITYGKKTKSFYTSTTNAIAMAHEQGKSLINDEGKYKIDTTEGFIQKKRQAINFYYQNSITRLKNKNYTASRNETNNRLDTNLTNMSSLLVDEICFQNNLMQLDLASSQFCLFSNHLTHKLATDDFIRFKTLSSSGNLYASIQQELGLKSVKEAKNAMFEILFSARNNKTLFKSKLKEVFPSVVAWIDEYKKANGDNQFSIMLQQIESDLFIDRILKRVKKLKYFCLTKHDSLIIRRSDYEAILSIVKEEFEKIGLEYTLKITNLYGVNEEHKISSNQQQQIEEEVEQELALKHYDINLHELTAIDIRDYGYTNIEFKTSFGQVVYVPRVFQKYWSSVKSKLGLMNRLSREGSQLVFDIELRKIVQNIFDTDCVV
ncbi:MAG: hypothetical protein ACK5RV_05305 [Flavobacterium sp.]|uniref:hypothetical protein n=1 Tax=Flavobacterium sp. TaxID=239 RepID=UPI0022C62F88|nr:hypothetical protein [Flavobacterium sp.]MCZ8169764.1 hypothetical protein [Flavobacterium sp.]MCZ8296001.1 hypothetical protein [Flavobacterium sp.]